MNLVGDVLLGMALVALCLAPIGIGLVIVVVLGSFQAEADEEDDAAIRQQFW